MGMKNILTLAILISIWRLASADTQDFTKCRVILIKSNAAYFDVGQKDGIAAGEAYEIYYDQRIVASGTIAWTDQNISRTEPLDSSVAANIYYLDPLTAKIRLYVIQANRGGYLNIAYFSDLNLDPATISTPEDMMVARLIHRGLLMRDRNGQIQPDLCGDYEIRNLTYTFYISPDAKFHNGKSVESSDVLYSLEQLARAPKLTNATCFVLEINGAEDFRNDLKNEIAGIFIVDEKIITITLRRPFPAFEEYLAGPGGYIIPRPGYVSSGSNIIGAGAYRMRWSDPTGLTLEPSEPNGQSAYLDSLRFVRFTNTEEAGLAFELDKLDLISLLGEPPPKFMARGNYSSQNTGTDSYVILGINNKRDFQAGQDFGKGLSFLLDRASIMRVILGGSAELPNFKVSAKEQMTYPFYDPFLPDSANYYLNQVISLRNNLTLYVDSSYPILTKVARYIEGQLQNRGIKIVEKKLDLSLAIDPKIASDMDLYLTTYIPVSGNPDCILYPMINNDLSGETNFLYFDEEAPQVFLDNLRTEIDPDRRISFAAGLAQSIASKPPLVALYQPYLSMFFKADVSGIVGDPAGYLDLRKVYIESGK
jgi:ABC-type transport system substrate-binding protein